MNPEIEKQIKKLQEKFQKEGQTTNPYLDGLYYANYLDYWDYINVDTLLTLQKPRTVVPDEMIFIIYHQITELYFKLSLFEIDQILNKEEITPEFFKTRLRRIINYFENLTRSFTIMINGMEVEQFLQFRLALYPASGFQSVQYRLIEIASTPFLNLVHPDYKAKLKDATLEEQFEFIYWKYGATEIDTGAKTLTLKRFETKYYELLINWAKQHKTNNIWIKYLSLTENNTDDEELRDVMREYDQLVNVKWPLQHYKSAARYLSSEHGDIPATGGTNWQKYLPPRFQRRVFYPALWNEEELENWGISRPPVQK